MSQVINLMLSLDECNIVLNALANLPYGQVNMLIPKLQQQAQSQLNPQPAPAPVATTVTPTETKVSSEALVDVNKP